jgi:2-dehydropantoate 2-reductase
MGLMTRSQADLGRARSDAYDLLFMSGDRLNVAVLGPGGVGGFLAAMLSREGSAVLVLASDNASRAIAESGLRLESRRFGDFTVSIRTAPGLTDPVDACFITVKATQLRDAVERVPANAVGAALVIPFLNGIEHVDFLRAVYPPSSVVAATIRIETAKVATGLIRHTSPFASVEIAASDENRDRVERIAAHLSASGLDVRIRDDELAMLWDKFVLLAPMALLTTHERANVGAIRTRRREDAIALIGEVVAVAAAEGVDIDREAVLRLLDSVPESMESSMQRDQAAGRALELDALGGALLRRATKAQIAVPVTRRLVGELQSRSVHPAPTGSQS